MFSIILILLLSQNVTHIDYNDFIINKDIENDNINNIPFYLKKGDILFCDFKPKINEYFNKIGIGSIGNYGYSDDQDSSSSSSSESSEDSEEAYK